MLSKQTKNTGAAGGHGMQEFSISYLQDCETFLEYKGGHVSSCSHCGETYILSPEHTFLDSLELNEVMKKDGCPLCNQRGGLTKDHLDWFLANRKKVQQFSFEIDKEKFIDAFYKPYTFKALNKTQLKLAWEEKEANKK